MKVVYSSKTGNTQKLAKAIASAVGVTASAVGEFSEDDEFLFVGFWVDKGEIDDDAREFLSKLKGKKIALFFTAGVEKEHEYVKTIMQKYIDEVSVNNKVLGCFMSQGKISDEIIAKRRQMAKDNPNDERFAITPQQEKRWEESAKHPNEKDLQEIIEFANNIIKNHF